MQVMISGPGSRCSFGMMMFLQENRALAALKA